MSALSRRGRTRSKQSSSSSGAGATDHTENLTAVTTSTTTGEATPPQKRDSYQPTLCSPPSREIDEQVKMTTQVVEGEASRLARKPVSAAPAPAISPEDAEAEDGRSSSLSDIEDGTINETFKTKSLEASGATNIDDSEAETERLENSPLKLLKNKNVVISAGNHKTFERVSEGDILSLSPQVEELDVALQTAKDEREADRGSATGSSKSEPDNGPVATNASLEDGDQDPTGVPSPPTLAGRKRKRSSYRSRTAPDEADIKEPAQKRTGSVKGVSNEKEGRHQALSPARNSRLDSDITDGQGGKPAASDVEENTTEVDPAEPEDGQGDGDVDGRQTRTRRNGKLQKQRHRAPVGNANEADNGEETAPADLTFEKDSGPAADADGEEGNIDAATRDEEELQKKRTAMDSLGDIEKQFATFRDRLFDERLTQLSQELTLLTQSAPVHPDFLAMLHCIDARRDEKIQLEQALLRYKVGAVQVRSVAERSQIHSQYFQTVRATRENKMEELGDQWYQIQRDRRGWEGTVRDYSYKFPTRRSQQITHQTAYNLEVSILSGVAKYVGFPTAPSIDGARPAEIDDDFKNMGIETESRSRIRDSSQALRATLSGPTIPVGTPAAEEQFLEQTPWANPRHPAHQHYLHGSQPQASQKESAGPLLSPTLTQKGKEPATGGAGYMKASGFTTSSKPVIGASTQSTITKRVSPNTQSTPARANGSGLAVQSIEQAETSFVHTSAQVSRNVNGARAQPTTTEIHSLDSVGNSTSNQARSYQASGPVSQTLRVAKQSAEPGTALKPFATHSNAAIQEERADQGRLSPLLAQSHQTHGTSLSTGIRVGSSDGR